MKIRYKHIKKIHLYASLSTVALLVMYIITSYMMMNHNLIDHDLIKEEKTVRLTTIPSNDQEWNTFAQQNGIEGRKTRESTNNEGNLIVEYGHAGGFARIDVPKNTSEAKISLSHKKTANAIIGIHRQRGYGGNWIYNLYAFFLDIIGVSLIIFVITGIIMWFKLLKNNKIAWIIFISGFIYVGVTIFLLLKW